MSVKLISKYTQNFISQDDLNQIASEVAAAHTSVHTASGAGHEMLGWLELPKNYDRDEYARIKSAAQRIKDSSDVLIVIGIGGSYLGARCAVEFIKSPFYNNLKKDTPEIYFAGNNISSDYLSEILQLCEGKDISVNIISKSGTTTEPAVAFRIFKNLLEEKYGIEESKKHIYCTTDKERGTLKTLADTMGYECFVIPDDVGGRFSVLTAVGLLPIAVCGIDIDKIMQGALDAMKEYSCNDIDKNDCYKYVALRNILHRKGASTEILVNYEPALVCFSEWWKQLYGESEGKDNKGIFPAAVTFSADLHSMGQYIQQGVRNLFETVVWINSPKKEIEIIDDTSNADGLNFLNGKNFSYVNKRAFEGTVLAHNDGGVPNIVISIDKADEYHFGYLVYFFEKACAVSGYVLGVNPFDQPGVEEYKKNMFALLGKLGFEVQKSELEKRL